MSLRADVPRAAVLAVLLVAASACGKDSSRASPSRAESSRPSAAREVTPVAVVDAEANQTPARIVAASAPSDAGADAREAGPDADGTGASADAGADAEPSDASLDAGGSDGAALDAATDAALPVAAAPTVVDSARPEDGMPERLDSPVKLCSAVLRRNAKAFAGLQNELYAGDSKYETLDYLCWQHDKGAWAIVFGNTKKLKGDANLITVTASYRVLHADAQGGIVYGDVRPAEFSGTSGLTFLASPYGQDVLAILVRHHLPEGMPSEERIWLKVEGATLALSTKPPPK